MLFTGVLNTYMFRLYGFKRLQTIISNPVQGESYGRIKLVPIYPDKSIFTWTGYRARGLHHRLDTLIA